MKKVATILACVTIAMAMSSHADDTIWIAGIGNSSCGSWVELRASNQADQQAAQWIFGFVSGHNIYSGAAQIRAPDAPSSLAFIDKYCRDNPLSTAVVGGIELVKALGGSTKSAIKPNTPRKN